MRAKSNKDTITVKAEISFADHSNRESIRNTLQIEKKGKISNNELERAIINLAYVQLNALKNPESHSNQGI